MAGRFVGTSGIDRLRFGACGDRLDARRGNGGRDGPRPTFSTRPPFVPAVEQLNPNIYLPFEALNENGVVSSSRWLLRGWVSTSSGWAGRPVRIEFEFRSKNFQTRTATTTKSAA